MSDGVELQFDTSAFEREADRVTRRFLTAATRAVGAVTKRLERRLEAATRDAVPGNLWRAWASETYPRSGPARNPAGEVFINGNKRTKGAIAFWTQPGSIRGKFGQYLAIPLPAAGSRGRARDLTPGEWERRNGIKLRFIYRQGKPSILAAVGATTTGARGQLTQAKRLTPGARGRAAQGRGGANPQADAVVPIFVLLPVVPFRNAFAIEPLVASAGDEVAAQFITEVSSLTGRR